MYNFSIIIPHKNCPSLLERCIKSIPTRNDIQIIIVDDNSNPFTINYEYILKQNIDNLTFVYTKEGKGAGFARNIGLSQAKGRWILFADSDDFFHENLNDLMEKYLKSDYDMIVFNTDSVLSETLQKVENRENIVQMYLKNRDFNILRFLHHAVWGKMFKRDFIDKFNITFQEVVASNDAYFAAKAGIYVNKYVYDPLVCYCCTVRAGSICTNLAYKNVSSRIKVAYDVNCLLKKNHIPYKYWMNLLGPIFNMMKINKKIFIKEFVLYIFRVPKQRIILDISESGKRFFLRLIGVVNDKDIKKMQRVYKK